MTTRRPRQETFKYLVLSGDLPGEGFWCTATHYDGLVEEVKKLWGDTFTPIFKYKMQASPDGAKEELRYHSADSAFRHTDTRPPKKSENHQDEPPNGPLGSDTPPVSVSGSGHACDIKVREAGMTGMCYVIIDDECDFSLWLNGGALIKVPDHGCGETHHADYHASDTARFDPLTQKIFAFRKTTQEVPNVLIHNKDTAMDSYHPYYHTVTNKDGVFRFRSSPAVKHSEDDVVRVPVHSLLAPITLVQLNITCVLRHSNASELILWSASSPLSGGAGWWGQLVHKASSAWGIHSPLFRYLDLTMGMQQMNITDVLNFRMWSDGVGLDRPELLVLEQAPSSDLCYDAFLKQEMLRHYKVHPPPPSKEVTLDKLVNKLQQLEREELDARVNRPVHVSVAGEKPGVVEEQQNHIGGIPLHRLGLAPPSHSRNTVRRTEKEEERRKAELLGELDIRRSRASETREAEKPDVDTEDQEEPPRPSLDELEGLLLELQMQGRKTEALEELIALEKEIRRKEEQQGIEGPILFEGIIPELSRKIISPEQSALPCSAPPVLLNEPATVHPTSPECVEGTVRFQPPSSGGPCPGGSLSDANDGRDDSRNAIVPPRKCAPESGTISSYEHQQNDMRLLNAYRRAVDSGVTPPATNILTSVNDNEVNQDCAAVFPSGRRENEHHMNMMTHSRLETIRKPYGPCRLDPMINSVQAGEYGPSFTTPAVLTTNEQQMEAEAHQRRVAEQFRRDQEMRKMYYRGK